MNYSMGKFYISICWIWWNQCFKKNKWLWYKRHIYCYVYLWYNSGVKYSYVDNNLISGYEYWYAVSAYDGVDDWAGAPVDPMENSKAKNAFYSDNVFRISRFEHSNSIKLQFPLFDNNTPKSAKSLDEYESMVDLYGLHKSTEQLYNGDLNGLIVYSRQLYLL